MNIWMDIAIPALLTDVALAAFALWAWVEWQEYKGRYDYKQREDSKTVEENVALHKQLEEQASHAVTLLAENGALKLKLDEALKPRTRGKAKTLNQERGRDV